MKKITIFVYFAMFWLSNVRACELEKRVTADSEMCVGGGGNESETRYSKIIIISIFVMICCHHNFSS
jgi:hypothetical protein